MVKRPHPITRHALAEAFKRCGLDSGDAVLVHSDLFAMGPVSGKSDRMLPTYVDAIWDVVGEKGTLVVPAFFYEYGRFGIPYDISISPVSRELGFFSRYVASQSGALRSPNPLTALAAVGYRAEYICSGGTGSSFGVDSPWDRLLQCDAKMMFVGVDLRFMTFIHFVEYMVGVPHLYSKFHNVPVLHDNREINLPISSQVRYLDFNVSYDVESITSKFEGAGLLKKAHVGQGIIRCVSSQVAFDFLNDKLKRDHSYLLKQTPNFVSGEVPMDGVANSHRS